ncbi:MAG: NAD(P)/FAD-dependent oxidoreductase [Acidobacteria bacterium]|nr:NAD(P)/FAD-dependent oxidoreductase [Acidobacteriota bacterium]
MTRASESENWAIVGGGLLGMTLALRLAEAGRQVTLFESAPELGGLASAWRLGEVVWDRHYHVTLLSDTHLRALLDELGLEKEMRWVETRTGFYTDGQLLSMSNTVEFLKFPPLGLVGKLRLGATIFYAARVKDWKRLEKVSVAEWLRKLSGRRTFEKIWLPLLRAKLGESYRQASAAFIWATIQRMYAARRTGLKKEMFGYVPGGYARILARFGEMLEKRGVRVHLKHKRRKVETETGGALALEFEDGAREAFDQVVLTVPGTVAARACAELTEEEQAKLKGVQYQGIICASLLLKKPLADFYVTNITDSFVPFTAVIEMSALVDREQFGGHALVYLPKYVAPDDAMFDLSDEEIRESFLNAIARMYPHFERSDVVAFQVSRVPYVFPLPTLNYSDKLPAMRTSVEGLHIINSAHIVNGTLNVNETVQLAEKSAARLLSQPERDVSREVAARVAEEYEDEAICQPVPGP